MQLCYLCGGDKLPVVYSRFSFNNDRAEEIPTCVSCADQGRKAQEMGRLQRELTVAKGNAASAQSLLAENVERWRPIGDVKLTPGLYATVDTEGDYRLLVWSAGNGWRWTKTNDTVFAVRIAKVYRLPPPQ